MKKIYINSLFNLIYISHVLLLSSVISITNYRKIGSHFTVVNCGMTLGREIIRLLSIQKYIKAFTPDPILKSSIVIARVDGYDMTLQIMGVEL